MMEKSIRKVVYRYSNVIMIESALYLGDMYAKGLETGVQAT